MTLQLPQDIIKLIVEHIPIDIKFIPLGLINTQWSAVCNDEDIWKNEVAQKYPKALPHVTKNYKKCYFLLESTSNIFEPRDDIKVVVLGEGGVGKSALIIRFITNDFVWLYESTMYVISFTCSHSKSENWYRKEILIDDTPHILNILDTAGPYVLF
jgi:ribosome biogenesis GTPase A